MHNLKCKCCENIVSFDYFVEHIFFMNTLMNGVECSHCKKTIVSNRTSMLITFSIFAVVFFIPYLLGDELDKIEVVNIIFVFVGFLGYSYINLQLWYQLSMKINCNKEV